MTICPTINTRSFALAALVLALSTPCLRAADDKPDQNDPPAPDDVRNVLDHLSMVRDLKKVAKPDKKGLWEDLVNQPFYTPAVKAEKLIFFGQYEEAEKQFAKLLKTDLKDSDRRAAVEGQLEAILRQGKEDDLKRFTEAVAKLPADQQESLRIIQLRAEALYQSGALSEVQNLLKPVVAKHDTLAPLQGPTSARLLSIYNLFGQTLQDQAQYPAAAALYEKVANLALEEIPDDPAIRTQIAIAIERWGILNPPGKGKNVLDRLNNIVQSDATYWPAHLEMARLLLASHNAKDGGTEVNTTLGLNPNSLEARKLALDFAIQSYNFADAQSQLEELKDLSDCAEISALEGRMLLKKRTPTKAIEPLLSALKRNPSLAEARGWLAGAYYLTNNQQLADEQLDAIKTPAGQRHPVVLEEAAEVLRDARQFKQAEDLYDLAAKEAAWWSEPGFGLAQLYMETGDNAKAKDAFDRSFKIDPFNQRAYNQLILLDDLKEKFETLETKDGDQPGHFIIRYDKHDAVLAQLAGEWLEKVRPDVCGYFQYFPEVKTTIEFYPSHEQFGVRTTGLPWIGTVGACTGNVIAMDVPRGAGASGTPFDWARVLRHEFTHTVTLGMTNNRIPHWLTEAAACDEEQAPRDWKDSQLLCSNYRAGSLFKIEELNWGFITPKKSTDRQLAYRESQWIYEYLVEKYGHEKMLAFLKCFKDGLTEQQAFKTTYQRSMSDLNADFLVWAGKQLESWGLPADTLPKMDEAEKLVKENPKDSSAKVTLAWLLLNAGQRDGVTRAEAILREALTIDPKSIKARELLGAVLSNQKKKDEAKAMLEAVVKDDPKRAVTLRNLGNLAMQDKKFDEAEKWFLLLQQVRPLEDTSYTNLAGIYLAEKKGDKAIAQLQELQQHEQADERIPRKLAQLLRADKSQLRDAETMAYKAIRINPYNTVNHQLLGQILLDENQPARAIEYWKIATTLQPRVPEYWAGLAEAQGQSGNLPAAKDAATKAAELQPSTPAKKWLENQ